MISNKVNFNNFILFSLWTSLWLSIGVNPEFLIEYFNYSSDKQENNFKNTLKFLRIFLPFLFCVIFLYLIFKQKIFFKSNFILNITSILLIMYFLLQTVSLVLSENDNINFYWVYASILLYLIVLSCFPKKVELIRFLIFVSIIILSIVFFKFTLPMYFKFFSSNYNFYNMWPVVYGNDFSSPRPTGLSRTALILCCFLLCFEFKNYFYKKFKYPLLIFLGLTICLFQSRTVLFIWPVLIVLFLFLENNSLKNKIKKFILILILPLFLFLSFNGLKMLSKYALGYLEIIKVKDEKQSINLENIKEFKNKIDTDTGKVQVLRDTDPRSFSSFRTKHWKEILSKTLNNNYLLGYGPMGDRFLIGTSASSLFFYSIAASGLIGFIVIGLLALRTFYLVCYFLFFNKKKSELDDILLFTCMILILVFLRGILETSIGIFSIDYCIYIVPALYIEYRYLIFNKKIN